MNYRNSTFKIKPTTQMKRSKLRLKSVSTTAQLKDDIQNLVREIVILKYDGCIFKKEKGHICTGYAKDGHLILQADHLLSRSNSATYADTRLIVCVCKGIHGWKSVGSNLRKEEYDNRVKKLLPKEVITLWEKAEKDRRTHKAYKMDWNLEKVCLEKELKMWENNL